MMAVLFWLLQGFLGALIIYGLILLLERRWDELMAGEIPEIKLLIGLVVIGSPFGSVILGVATFTSLMVGVVYLLDMFARWCEALPTPDLRWKKKKELPEEDENW